jgi:adenylate cyclase class 2
MQNAEIELKFRVASLPDFERRLQELGLKLDTPRTFEANTLYDTPVRSLKAKGELLRLRRYGNKHLLTHKRHPDEEDLNSLYKIRIETESEVSDGAAVGEIFGRMGYVPVFRYEKYRSEYSDPQRSGAHLVLDETPIGVFAELEGPTDWIDRTLCVLGVSHGDCLTESYGRLFLAWKAKTGSPAENLVFDEIGMLVGTGR